MKRVEGMKTKMVEYRLAESMIKTKEMQISRKKKNN